MVYCPPNRNTLPPHEKKATVPLKANPVKKNSDTMAAAPTGLGDEAQTPRLRRKFILCFDGTGNKFQGTAGDSNSGFPVSK